MARCIRVQLDPQLCCPASQVPHSGKLTMPLKDRKMEQLHGAPGHPRTQGKTYVPETLTWSLVSVFILGMFALGALS